MRYLVCEQNWYSVVGGLLGAVVAKLIAGVQLLIQGFCARWHTSKKFRIVVSVLVYLPLLWKVMVRGTIQCGGVDLLSIFVYRTMFAVLLKVFSLQTIFFVMLLGLVAYFILGLLLFFYWGTLGLRGLFYLAEFLIGSNICLVLLNIYINLKYHIALSLCLGELLLSTEFTLTCIINLDLLAMMGVLLVLMLTGIILTFGVEYMTREAFAYNVVVILIAFSASIVWFILSYSLGLMTIFWELAGLFSLLLVDTFYTRIRTTQAVSRTYAVGRFSDYCLFIATGELYAMIQTDALSTLFAIFKFLANELPTLLAYFVETPAYILFVGVLILAAACKSAQFFIFVWLPDAMEAPTPASALIHSSTLVVMGVFMMLRLAPVYKNCITVLYILLLAGALTVLYGSVFAAQTGDLKKAVAYSTISQIGYLYCGCGLLALRETLIYLVVHAICKAMLFVFVGYIVHMFGGTTAMRKMGGVFNILPEVALSMFILCMILAGAPYTLGFIAKELIVHRLLLVSSPVMCVVVFCWVVAFLCTPIYMYRVCVLTLFGRARCSRKIYRNLLLLKNKVQLISLRDFNLKILKQPLAFFIYHTRDLQVSGRVTSLLHALIIIFILYTGEFFILLVGGFFGTTGTLTGLWGGDLKLFALTATTVYSYHRIKMIQLLILILFFTVTAYIFILSKAQSKSQWTILACLLLLFVFFIAVTLIIYLSGLTAVSVYPKYYLI